MASVTRERLDQGMPYEQYKAQMTRNQDRLAANEQNIKLAPEDLAAFQGLPKRLTVLALAEDWCGDVIANLPVLGRLAAESGKLDLRIFLRDQNLDLMDQYLNKGQFRSIPTVIFFDDDLNELGRFVERPESVTVEVDRRRRELFAQNPEFGEPGAPIDQLPEDVRVRLQQGMADLRAAMFDFSNAEVVKAIREIVEKAR